MKLTIAAFLGSMLIGGAVNAEVISYRCNGGVDLQIEFSADGKTATPLNNVSNAAIMGARATAQPAESGVSYLAMIGSLPMTMVGPSKLKLHVVYGRRQFDCEAV